MEIVVFYNISLTESESYAQKVGKYKSEILLEFGVENSKADVEAFVPERIERDLNEAIAEVLKYDGKLVICRFKDFCSSKVLLQTLYDKVKDFCFFDDKSVSHADIPSMIKLLTYQSQIRGIQIKNGIRKSMAKGQKIGLAASSKETMQAVLDKASNVRSYKALLDEKNIESRNEILNLYNVKRLSFNKIAQDLNERGFRTSKGNKFIAKSVIRQYEVVSTLRTTGGHNDEYTQKTQVLKKSSKEEIKVSNFDNGTNYNEGIIVLNILNENVKTEIKVYVYNNSEEKVFLKSYPKEEKEIKIDYLKDVHLFPGLYYIKIKSKGLSSVMKYIFIHQEALPPLVADAVLADSL